MKKLVKFLFLLFLYNSNISAIIFIYPIIYFIFDINDDTLKWYYFGIILSIYEIGKFFGLFFWDFLYNKYSIIILIIISLSFLCVFNISYIFAFSIYYIIIIRFFSGFFNNIGKFSKDITLQLGIKQNLQLIICIISIICTVISLFLPAIISKKIRNTNDFKNNNIKDIYKITLYFALINILSILTSLYLILTNNFKIRKKNKNFMRMNNQLEKLEYSRNNQKKKIPESTLDSNRSKDIKYNKKYGNLKIKDNIIDNQNSGRNININSYAEKTSSKRYSLGNKKEDDSKLGKRSSLHLFEKQKIVETGKEIEKIEEKDMKTKLNEEKEKRKKIFRYNFINLLKEISDSLNLIWSLIILYLEFSGNPLSISYSYSLIRILGDIISFSINTIIIKNTSNYNKCKSQKISRDIWIMNVFLFFITILSNAFIYIYFFYFSRKKIFFYLLMLSIIIKNVIGNIFTQLFKIFLVKDFIFHGNNMNLLRKYRQYCGTLAKSITFLIGSFGYVLIYNVYFNIQTQSIFVQFSKLSFILYFIVFPSIINLILIILSKIFI